MKRGFLLSTSASEDGSRPKRSTATSHSQPVALNATAEPAQAAKQIATKPRVVKIPSGPLRIEKEVPAIGTFPKGAFNMVVTMIPPYSIFEPTEQLSCVMLFEGMKEAILSLPGFPAPLIPPPHQPYRVGSAEGTEGGGMGLFATDDIDIGDLIICERPLVVSPQAWPVSQDPNHLSPFQVMEYLISRLSLENQQAFWSLANCKGKDAHPIKGIVDTNTVAIGALPGYNGQYGGICKEISRANHSCSPNAAYRWHLDSFTFELRATFPVAKGAQIFVQYLGPSAPRAHRQGCLYEMYSFKCRCRSCSLPLQESRRSDTRRALLSQTAERDRSSNDAELKAWVKNANASDDLIIKQCQRMISMMDEEGYYDENIHAVYFQWICKAYCALGDGENAKLWAEKARKLAVAFTRKDCGWDAVVAAPQNTDWWGLKIKSRKVGSGSQ